MSAGDVLEAFVGDAPLTATGACDAIVDPSTGAAFAQARRTDAAGVDAAVAAARAALPAWAARPVAERAQALLELAQLVADHAEELAELESRNTGKPLAAVRSDEIPFVVDNLRFFAGAARTLEGRAAGEYLPQHTSFVRREAIGVIGQICPWNYPLMMAGWKIGPALAAGNAVVLKPAEQTPCSALRLAELAVGTLPPGVLNVVCGDRGTGQLLAGHADVDMVAITGSTGAGRQVALAAGERVAQVHLELGGNAPVVVFDDGLDDAALDAIAGAAFYNAGQDCTAATRVIAQRGVYERVVEGLAARTRDWRAGDPRDPATTLGPLISAAQRERVAGLVAGRRRGTRLLAGGEPGEGGGFHYAPTVIAELEQDDALVREEIFGPVVTVQPFEQERDALLLANGTPFGLAGSVWTADVDRAMRMSRRLDVGCVWVNDHFWLCSEMPHGGFGGSGYGKDLSPYAVEEYTRVKHVMIRGREI